MINPEKGLTGKTIFPKKKHKCIDTVRTYYLMFLFADVPSDILPDITLVINLMMTIFILTVDVLRFTTAVLCFTAIIFNLTTTVSNLTTTMIKLIVAIL